MSGWMGVWCCWWASPPVCLCRLPVISISIVVTLFLVCHAFLLGVHVPGILRAVFLKGRKQKVRREIKSDRVMDRNERDVAN